MSNWRNFLTEFKKFAGLLAEQSGEIIRQYFRTPFSVENKRDASPVTIADRKAEEVMRELIMKEFPQHGIIGEEADNHQSDAEYKWVLDPIDGTLNFICGGWMFGTLIALLQENEPILGVIHQPILNELVAGDNVSTTFNGENVRVRNCDTISDAALLTTDPYLIKQYQNFEAFEKLRRSVKIYRGWGDCYGYVLLATGQVD
ncbi:histidinol-phosphatase, partial [candidate division KSB1 bacterium]|nr:histidinol-phosphatase [candidate division KSB1 bacterium]NIR71009.1 histidinol-phosphatase [candidate division KSB1 bacterium]NIS26094.1 histidinol-phosphatase [candidate division KSB1 bacterium]NIT72888.1 histidinol-phosphatase [candidate division KSB1 bacterium]NIU26733.1 histidinol-phosphatase [candidate division KSB1 bacterium]